MKLISSNNEILKFIKEQILKKPPLFRINGKQYNINIDLEKYAMYDVSTVTILIECEVKFNININDRDAWSIQTPLDLYNTIQKEINRK